MRQTATTTTSSTSDYSSCISYYCLSSTTCSAASDLLRQAQKDNNSNAKTLLQSALCLQEASAGYFDEGTAEIYYLLAWFYYEKKEFLSALTYFLQSIRISLQLHGEHHCATLHLLDDLKDLLDDMHLNEDCVNPVFDSWALQDDASDLNDDPILAEQYLQDALCLIPADLELERATIYFRLGRIYQANHQIERSLSYCCQALMILPYWLTSNHPLVAVIQKQSHHVASSLTPMIPVPKNSLTKTSSWRHCDLSFSSSSSFSVRRGSLAASE